MKTLITAGPTREPLDPVRYLTNRSSGKMGYAIADAAADADHHVILISGPTNIAIPSGVDYIPVETSQEMYDAVEYWIQKCDIAIFTAAVADYRPVNLATQKLKKRSETMTIEFVKNPDILGSARESFGFTGVLAGFAAETENLIEHAREKLVRKDCDVVFVNDVSQPGVGFNSDKNELVAVFPDHEEPLGHKSKSELGVAVISMVERLAQKK